jgi:hypothetical protein
MQYHLSADYTQIYLVIESNEGWDDVATSVDAYFANMKSCACTNPLK